MWGQDRPLKSSITVWLYCSCRKLGVPFTVSIQKVEKTVVELALGPPAPPFRKAVLAVPPPVNGATAWVVTSSTVVLRIV